MTENELKMFEAVQKYQTPKSPEELKSATMSVLSATLLRSELSYGLYDALRETAQFALRLYMETLSIKYTEQRWADGIEFSLYRAAKIQREKMSDAEANQLVKLFEQAGGWWTVSNLSDEPRFMPDDDWKAVFDDWINNGRT